MSGWSTVLPCRQPKDLLSYPRVLEKRLSSPKDWLLVIVLWPLVVHIFQRAFEYESGQSDLPIVF